MIHALKAAAIAAVATGGLMIGAPRDAQAQGFSFSVGRGPGFGYYGPVYRGYSYGGPVYHYHGYRGGYIGPGVVYPSYRYGYRRWDSGWDRGDWRRFNRRMDRRFDFDD